MAIVHQGDSMQTTLIIGTYRQTLTVIRSLARAGQHIILGLHGDAETTDHSKYVDETWHHPDPALEPDEFSVALSKLLKQRADVTSLIPVGETDLRFFVHRFTEFSQRVNLLMCQPNIIETCLDKPTMSALVDELGIPQARYAIASDRASLLAAAESIGFPCVVKLVDSEHLLNGLKAIIYTDSDSLRHDMAEWPAHNKSIIVQEYVQGERHNLYFFADCGRIASLGQSLALRTDRVDDTGLSVSGITVAPDPELVGHCQTIVEHLNYSGPGCMQFLYDRSKRKFSFLEHNPRLGAGFALIYHTGLDLPRLMLEWAMGELNASVLPAYPCKTGARYAWITGDLVGLKRAMTNDEVDASGAWKWALQLVSSAFSSSVHITWDWRDPYPTIVQLGRFLRLVPSETPTTDV